MPRDTRNLIHTKEITSDKGGMHAVGGSDLKEGEEQVRHTTVGPVRFTKMNGRVYQESLALTSGEVVESFANILGGGGGGAAPPENTPLGNQTVFSDDDFEVFDASTPTARLNFNLANVSADTIATLTIPDSDITVIGTNESATLTSKIMSTGCSWVGDTVAVGYGGTGLSTVGTNQILTGNGTSALTSEANLTFSGSLLNVGDTVTVSGAITSNGTITAEHFISTDDAVIADTLTVDYTMTLSTGSIVDTTGAISFGDENLNTTGVVTAAGFTIGSAVINETDLEQIDDLTAGTVTASKAVVVDSNKDIGTIRNLTIDGVFTDGNYTFDTSGNVSSLGTVGCGAITSTGNSTFASATISDLTNNRVVIAGTSGAVEDDSNFTYDGATLVLNDNLNVSSNDLYVNHSTGNVGIGVNDPDIKLEIFTTGTQLKLSYDVDTFTTLGVANDGTLTIANTDSGNILLDTGGSIHVDPTGNQIDPVNNYDVNIGQLSKKYLTLHAAELWVETLVAQDTIATIGGRVLVAPTTYLTVDLGSGGGDTTITVKHNQMVNNDIVYMEANGQVEFMEIQSAAGGSSGAYTYTVDRDLDGSGINAWYAGDAILNTGQTGDGFIDLYSVRGVNAGGYGPTIVGNVRTAHADPPNDYADWDEAWAIGNLNGHYGYGSDTYGVGLGQYASGKNNITVDPTNGIRFRNHVTLKGQLTEDAWTIGTDGQAKLTITDTSITMYDGSSTPDPYITIDDTPSIRVGTSDQSNILITDTVITLDNASDNKLEMTSEGLDIYQDDIKCAIFGPITVIGGATAVATDSTDDCIRIDDSGVRIYQDAGDYVAVAVNGVHVYAGGTKRAQFGTTTSIGGDRLDTSDCIRIEDGTISIFESADDKVTVTSSGLTCYQGGDSVANFGSTVTVGEVGPSKSNVYITSGAIQLRNNETPAFEVDSSGNMEMTGRCKADLFGFNAGLLRDNSSTTQPKYLTSQSNTLIKAIDIRGGNRAQYIILRGTPTDSLGDQPLNYDYGNIISHIIFDTDWEWIDGVGNVDTALSVTIVNQCQYGGTGFPVAFRSDNDSSDEIGRFEDVTEGVIGNTQFMDFGHPYGAINKKQYNIGTDFPLVIDYGGSVTFTKQGATLGYAWEVDYLNSTRMPPFFEYGFRLGYYGSIDVDIGMPSGSVATSDPNEKGMVFLDGVPSAGNPKAIMISGG